MPEHSNPQIDDLFRASAISPEADAGPDMDPAEAQLATTEPNIQFRDGTSETKNWILSAGALSETGLEMELMDYVPCYRSEAGTGNAMAFATWS